MLDKMSIYVIYYVPKNVTKKQLNMKTLIPIISLLFVCTGAYLWTLGTKQGFCGGCLYLVLAVYSLYVHKPTWEVVNSCFD